MNKFVIHEHQALVAGWHHDLRLERNGVFKSWALPKGVPEEPGVRRLAAPVEASTVLVRSQFGIGERMRQSLGPIRR